MFTLITLLACAPKGTQPTDMSATSHSATAAGAEASAAEHAAQYDPAANIETERCHAGKGGRVCWSVVVNPTAEHQQQADELRRLAALHRDASEVLRAAEASACAGLAPEDRDVSPFMYATDVASVEPIIVVRGGKFQETDTRGATVTVRAVPGLTAEWLQRIVDCHLARDAALGNVVPEMPDCPLVPAGVSAKVSSTGAGFAVEIRAGTEAIGQDVLARARRLTASTPTPPP